MLPISDKYLVYSKDIVSKLKEKGFRVEIDDRAEKIGFKIREAQLEKVPYMLILGEKESDSGKLSVRSRDLGEIGEMSFEDFSQKLKKEVDNKEILSK